MSIFTATVSPACDSTDDISDRLDSDLGDDAPDADAADLGDDAPDADAPDLGDDAPDLDADAAGDADAADLGDDAADDAADDADDADTLAPALVAAAALAVARLCKIWFAIRKIKSPFIPPTIKPNSRAIFFKDGIVNVLNSVPLYFTSK